MDDLEQIFRHLVRTVRARHPQYLERPFEVRELHQEILPYRHHRRELGLETNEDYEIAMLRLLAGIGGYLIVDDRMRDRLQAELGTANPDPGVYRDFADARVALSPDAVARLEGRAATADPAMNAGSPLPVSAPTPATPPAIPTKPAAPTATPMATEGRCQHCGGVLPTGREVTYCPHCGQNLRVDHCSGCSSELDPDWRFCVTCGRPTGRAAP